MFLCSKPQITSWDFTVEVSVVSFDHLCVKEKWINSLFVNILWRRIISFFTYTLVKLDLSSILSCTSGYGQLLNKPGNISIGRCSMAVTGFENIFGHQQNCFWPQETPILKPMLIFLNASSPTSCSLLVIFLFTRIMQTIANQF